jgi:UrcA family protein
MFRIASLATAAVLAASAASASDLRLSYGDLDLSTREGAARLDTRIRQLANQLCDNRTPVQRLSCRAGVREEALSNLPAQARTEYARGSRSFEA